MVRGIPHFVIALTLSTACLESLKFKEMNFRKENIVSANDDTCGWLLENANYARWIKGDDGLLWIQGKAGAGKSTLMKFIYEKSSQIEFLLSRTWNRFAKVSVRDV
jgi:ABC-type molybdenum transport system ATPase subunit/photorepair protein PhrA